MVFGSHLYGTNTPESDMDYKGIALPSWEQIALGKIPKHVEYSSTGNQTSRNTAKDTDIEIFSLHEFIKLALEGQTVAFDMLHAPQVCILENSNIWEFIQDNKREFYSRRIGAFLGYAQTQAAKYGIKGSRLNDAKAVLEWLDKQPEFARLFQCDLSTFPIGDHIEFVPTQIYRGTQITEAYRICGKEIQTTVTIPYAYEIVNRFYQHYGDRARQAALGEGVDWKAVSHAVRAGFQIVELLKHGTITFPRPEAEYLVKVKTGQLPYAEVSENLEALIERTKLLQQNSTLSEEPNRDFWETFLMNVVRDIAAREMLKETS
jgi:hypothetical protein